MLNNFSYPNTNVDYYNNVRLHSAIGYIAPRDRLEGREKEIFAARDRKLVEARRQRKLNRQSAKKGDVIKPAQVDFSTDNVCAVGYS